LDFELDDTQRSIAELASAVLGGDPDGTRAEHAATGELGYDETLWKAMAQAGLLGLAVPAELGGDGLGPVEVAIVLREVGRQILPVPALATLAGGVLPLAYLGQPRQRELLADVADGRVLTPGLRGTVSATRDGETLVLAGRLVGVAYAAAAHRILAATDAGVFLVDPHAEGVSCIRTPTSSKAAEYTVVLSDAVVSAAELVTTDRRAVERFALAGAAAVADGVLDAALGLTAAHIRERRQFDKPLATLQAVAQQIADIYVTSRTMHLVATSASWRLATGLDADGDVDIAGYWLATEVPAAVQACHHLHGGLGVDHSYPLHRLYSHAKDLARFVGGSAARLDAIDVGGSDA
jgi:alkylation response protein AidB-like acyl-CoA dehydrogenase